MPSSALMGRARKISRALLGFRGKRAAVLAVFLGFGAASSSVFALGLGPLEVQSNLGSPLQATAPIQLGSGESADQLEVAIASESDYQMVGKPRPSLVAGLKARLINGDSPSVQVTSSRPIEDPLFEVMLRVTSDGNQVLKMYTVTLDPPQVAEPGAQSSRKTESAPPPSVASTSQRQAGPSPDRPRIQTRELPPRSRESAQPRATGEGPQLAEAGPAVDRPKVEVTEGWSKRDRYGPVRSGDTLTTIVQRLRQDSSVPLEAAVVATWKANPEAFIGGNMNLVKKGAVLDIPDESRVRQYQPAQAEKLIKQQRKEWGQRGQPVDETSPGHERYRLNVSLQDPDGNGSSASSSSKNGSGDQDESEGGGASPGGEKANGGSGGESEQSDTQDGSGKASGSQAANDKGEGKGADSPSSPENAAIVADLRTRITELQQSLRDQRTDNKSTIQAMEKRVSGLQEKLEKQRKLVAQKNAAMERLANQSSDGGGSGMPGRDRYILYLLAGVNLLMLLAVIALWMRLRSVKAGAEADGGSAGGDLDDGAGDPLSQANAQAAAGEFKQARSTLWEALAGDPQNWALYGRLLDLYEQEEDGDQFEEVARRLFGQLGDQQKEWQEEIRNRGRQLKPESTLFGLSGGTAEVASAPPAFDFEGLDLEGPASSEGAESADAGAPENAEELAAPGEGEVEGPEEESFDLDFNDESPEEPVQSSGGSESGAGQEEGPADEGLELDFDLGSGESEPAEPEAAAEQPAQAPEEDGLEFDLGLSDEGAAEPEASGEAGQEEEGLELPGLDESTDEDDLALPGGDGQADAGSEISEAGGGEEVAEDEGLDLDLSLDSDVPADEAEPTTEASGGGDQLGELDLGEPDSEAGDDDLELRAAGPEPAEAGAQEDDLSLSLGDGGETGGEDDLDMDFSGWDESQEPAADQGGGEVTPQPDEPVPGPAAAEGPAPGGGQDEDEFEIKLDLAQAWIDMGDQDSARGLLQEVEARGGPQQKERAQQLLGSMN